MSAEAYFVRLGDSEDELALYRKQDGETTKIIDGLDDRINVNPVDIRLKVECLIVGYWSLWVDLLDGNGWVLEGVVQDSEINASAYSGINCIYTSTRSDRFYIWNGLYRQCCSKYQKHRGSKYKSDFNRI